MEEHFDQQELQDYYARRAHQYERIYGKPERQADLARLRESIPAVFDGRDVRRNRPDRGQGPDLLDARGNGSNRLLRQSRHLDLSYGIAPA